MPLPPPAPDSTALVTGASAGIGEALARALAERGHGVTLVARRGERLEALARDLGEAHGIRAEWIAADLSDGAQRDRVAAEIESRGLTVEVLVNNAGFGIYGPFAGSDRERELEQVRLLVEAVVDFDARYVPGMVERGRGAVVNLASTAGFQALPGNGTYAASKSFVLLHTESLSEEVRPHGVTVTAVCPGPVPTEFQEHAKPAFTDRMPKLVWCDATRVAHDALRAVDRGKRTVIPGGPAVRMFFAPNRMAPSKIALPVARRIMSKELGR
ncbi:MAG TPA: SDR family oxidoreductase [Solirubrobacteraceae bacterium]|nr:SDR family oxidoreductase [Solirubrobacteraceae bacterium]